MSDRMVGGESPARGDVLERVRQTLVELEALEADAIRPESRLTDDLGLDSLGQIELQMALEEAYDVTLDENAAASIQTVQQVADAISAALRVRQ